MYLLRAHETSTHARGGVCGLRCIAVHIQRLGQPAPVEAVARAGDWIDTQTPHPYTSSYTTLAWIHVLYFNMCTLPRKEAGSVVSHHTKANWSMEGTVDAR